MNASIHRLRCFGFDLEVGQVPPWALARKRNLLSGLEQSKVIQSSNGDNERRSRYASVAG